MQRFAQPRIFPVLCLVLCFGVAGFLSHVGGLPSEPVYFELRDDGFYHPSDSDPDKDIFPDFGKEDESDPDRFRSLADFR